MSDLSTTAAAGTPRTKRPARSVRPQAQTAFMNGSAADKVFSTFDSYAPLAYMLPWEILDQIEIIARWNPDMSQAVNNSKTLANSGHDLYVEARSPRAAEKIKSRMLEKARDIQKQHGGIDGLIGKLLDQACTFGAMCGEWVLSEELDDVVDFVDVNPKSIRFFWEDNHWAPYQKVSAAQAEEAKRNGQRVRNGNCVKLNELTFQYFAFDAAPGSPYGTPPFIAALKNIGIQQDMVENMSKIVKKIGLLGVLDVVVNSLPMERGESQEQYEARAKQVLDDVAVAVESTLEDGGFAHFDDVELKATNLSGNAAGATNIFKQNEELIFSGLRSMPSVQGRSYSTTETYAGVAYDIIIRNTWNYQRAVKRMVEAGYWLMASVWGLQPKSVKLEFHKNKSLHRLQDAQAELLEIKVALMLWAAGVIDQQGFAQRLGFNTPVKPYALPPESNLLGNTSPGGGGGNSSTDDGITEPARSDGEDNNSARHSSTPEQLLEWAESDPDSFMEAWANTGLELATTGN